jgi:hypothetical protein
MKKATTTIDELFDWYMGSNWMENWQVTNTMLVDGVHAQDIGDDNYGTSTLEKLVELMETEVEVTGEKNQFDDIWDISFILEGKSYIMTATAFFGEEGY